MAEALRTDEPSPGLDADLSRRITRNPFLEILHCGDDEVVVKHGSRSRFTKNIRDEGRTKLLGRLLRNVVPATTLGELVERGVIAGEDLDDAVQLVGYLVEQGVLVDPAADETRTYLETILGGGTPLAEKHVGLIGAGYLGSRIADQLARLGVGALSVLDARAVERPEVDARYFGLPPEALAAGRPYAECLAAHLAARGDDRLTVVPGAMDEESAVETLVAGCDFLVVALELFSARVLHLANSVAIAHGRPWTSVYVDGSEVLVGPLYVPGESCCYNEFEVQHESTLGAMKDDYLVYKEALDRGSIDGSHFVFPPYLDVASGLATTGIVRFLLSGRSFLVGRCNRLDFERLSVDYEEVLRLPRCPACSPSRPGYRHLFM